MRWIQGDRIFAFVAVVMLLFVAFVCVYPFLNLLAVSVSGNAHVLRGDIYFLPKDIHFRMYELVLNDARVLNGYKNTLIYVMLGTVVSLAVTSAGAFALSKKKLLFRRGVMLYILFTILFYGGMIPSFLVVKELGLVNTIWAMVLPTAVNTWYLIIMRTFFSGLPEEVEEAGKIDGLNDLGLFLRIALPLSGPILATIGLFYSVGIWNNFYSALLYLRDQNLFPLQVQVRNLVLATIETNAAQGIGKETVVAESFKAATIMVSTIPILLVYPFLQKYFVKGALVGSVKG